MWIMNGGWTVFCFVTQGLLWRHYNCWRYAMDREVWRGSWSGCKGPLFCGTDQHPRYTGEDNNSFILWWNNTDKGNLRFLKHFEVDACHASLKNNRPIIDSDAHNILVAQIDGLYIRCRSLQNLNNMIASSTKFMESYRKCWRGSNFFQSLAEFSVL